MILVHLLEHKIALLQLINKHPVHLATFNIFIFPAIDRVFYAVWSLHEIYISCGVAYKIIVVIYSLVTNILVEIHIIV